MSIAARGLMSMMSFMTPRTEPQEETKESEQSDEQMCEQSDEHDAETMKRATELDFMSSAVIRGHGDWDGCADEEEARAIAEFVFESEQAARAHEVDKRPRGDDSPTTGGASSRTKPSSGSEVKASG
jgi:hypothetical protein